MPAAGRNWPADGSSDIREEFTMADEKDIRLVNIVRDAYEGWLQTLPVPTFTPPMVAAMTADAAPRGKGISEIDIFKNGELTIWALAENWIPIQAALAPRLDKIAVKTQRP